MLTNWAASEIEPVYPPMYVGPTLNESDTPVDMKVDGSLKFAWLILCIVGEMEFKVPAVRVLYTIPAKSCLATYDAPAPPYQAVPAVLYATNASTPEIAAAPDTRPVTAPVATG
jgi:hypothetical protein